MRLRSMLLTWAVTAAALGACAAPKELPLRVGTFPFPGYGAIVLARELGYLRADRVQVVEFVSSSQVQSSFRHGSIDLAALTLDEVLRLRDAGADPVVVAIIDFSAGIDAVVARAGLAQLRDLAGKRVGVETNGVGGFFLSRALQTAGMTVRDVDVVHVDLENHAPTWERGTLDALVTFDPARKRVLAAGAHAIFDSTQLPREIVDVLVVNRPVLTRRSAEVAELLDAYYRAVELMKRGRPEPFATIAPSLLMSPNDVREAYGLLEVPSRQESLAHLRDAQGQFRVAAVRLSDYLFQSGLTQVRQPPEPVLWQGELGGRP